MTRWSTLAILCLSLLVFSYTLFSVYRIITTLAPDYPVYYQSTLDLENRINPYTDKRMPTLFIYPPVTTLLFLPFTLFPYAISQSLFIILSMLSVPAIVYCSLKSLKVNFSWKYILLITAFVYLSFPTKFTLGMGQVNLLALFLLTLGYYNYRNNRVKTCVVFFNLAFLAKPILCFMILFFITQKAWKIFEYLLFTCFVLLLFSFFLYGFAFEKYYVVHVVPNLITGTAGREIYYNQGIMGFISRLTVNAEIRKYGSLLVSVLLLCYTWYSLVKNNVHKDLQFAVFLLMLPLLDPLSWQHYFVFLIFPFIVSVLSIMRAGKYLLFFPLTLAYLLVSWNFKNPSPFMHFPEVLLLSNTFIGGVILLILLFDLFRIQKNKE